MKSFKLFLEQVELFNLNEGSAKDFKERSIERQKEIKSKQQKLRSDYQERLDAQRKSTKNKHHGSLVVGLVKLAAKSAVNAAKKQTKKALKRKKS